MKYFSLCSLNNDVNCHFRFIAGHSINHAMMIENPFIVSWRKRFIIELRECRAAGRPIYYLDESYYHQFSTRNKVWIDTTVVSAADVRTTHHL